MRFNKISAIFLLSSLLLLLIPITAAAVSNADLPWNWLQVTSNGQDLFLGLGTRNPDLGDNIGLELGATYNSSKLSPGLDLLYFFDPSDNYSFNVGVGIFANNSDSNAKYNTTFSGGFWFYLSKALVSIGYHSQQGLILRGGLRF
jgi:hypothetical protein